jgi:hypothetical protein
VGNIYIAIAVAGGRIPRARNDIQSACSGSDALMPTEGCKMGDSYRVIVDPVATLTEAPILAAKVMEYMISRGIISPERRDCVLSKDQGYPPGNNVGEALAQWTPEYTPGVPVPLDQIGDTVRGCVVNGVIEVVGRTVFFNFVDLVRCPLCQADNVHGEWGDAVSRWNKGDDLALLKCICCNEKSPLTEWTFDPPWAFGNLGFEFWNWGPMKRSFVDKVSELLGHKVVSIARKVMVDPIV